MTEWKPVLSRRKGTIHSELLLSLRRDIASGRLVAGQQMPTHRELAKQLGIGVGTVTRAYAEAERLGLLSSAVGRGTFVTGSQPDMESGTGMIDLTLNVQVLEPVQRRLGDALMRLRERTDLGEYVNFAPIAGIEWHRQEAAGWLKDVAHFPRVKWEHLLMTTGSQHAMSLVVDHLCRAGDTVLVEAASFSGFLALLRSRGLEGCGVAMDAEGMIPAALEEAIDRTGSRVVYLQPTLHNPTTRTMSRQRREQIADIAERRGIWIIEDDVYAAIAIDFEGRPPRRVVPVSVLAPERTFYIGSFSKVLAPGFRVGFLLAPDAAAFAQLCIGMRASSYSASTLGALVVMQWIRDGIAREIRQEIAAEADWRMRQARRILGDVIEPPSFSTSLHVWMPMSQLRAEQVLNDALRRGVMLTPPSSFNVLGEQTAGLRLCLNVVDRAQLDRALHLVDAALTGSQHRGHATIV